MEINYNYYYFIYIYILGLECPYYTHFKCVFELGFRVISQNVFFTLNFLAITGQYLRFQFVVAETN